MTQSDGLPCPACNNGVLTPRNEIYNVRIGESRFAKSDPVHFLSCSNCGEAIFIGNESEKADRSAAKNILKEILLRSRKMTGEDTKFVRSVLKLSARELSLRLELDASTVSQWETRKGELSFPVAFAVAIFFFRELMKDDENFAEEITNIVTLAFKKNAA